VESEVGKILSCLQWNIKGQKDAIEAQEQHVEFDLSNDDPMDKYVKLLINAFSRNDIENCKILTN